MKHKYTHTQTSELSPEQPAEPQGVPALPSLGGNAQDLTPIYAIFWGTYDDLLEYLIFFLFSFIFFLHELIHDLLKLCICSSFHGHFFGAYLWVSIISHFCSQKPAHMFVGSIRIILGDHQTLHQTVVTSDTSRP